MHLLSDYHDRLRVALFRFGRWRVPVVRRSVFHHVRHLSDRFDGGWIVVESIKGHGIVWYIRDEIRAPAVQNQREPVNVLYNYQLFLKKRHMTDNYSSVLILINKLVHGLASIAYINKIASFFFQGYTHQINCPIQKEGRYIKIIAECLHVRKILQCERH